MPRLDNIINYSQVKPTFSFLFLESRGQHHHQTQVYWCMRPLGSIFLDQSQLAPALARDQHWLRFTYVTSVLSEWRLWENQPSQLPRVTTSGEGLCCEREPKESRLWDTRWDVSADHSHWASQHHLSIRSQVSNSGPQAKFGPQCNYIWHARQYRINTRAPIGIIDPLYH